MRHGRLDRRIAGGTQLRGESVLCGRLAVHEVDIRHGTTQPCTLSRIANAVEPALQLVPVAMSTVAGQYLDTGAQWDLLAKHTYHRRVLHNSAPGRGGELT